MEELEEKEIEFGAIDNDGDIKLLDDEEMNTTNFELDEGISFESLIGEDDTKEFTAPIISSYSTQELNELEQMINSSEEIEPVVEEVEDNFRADADDSDFNSFDVDSIEFTSEFVGSDNVSNIDIDNITIDEVEEIPETEEEKVEEIVDVAENNDAEEETTETVEELEEETEEVQEIEPENLEEISEIEEDIQDTKVEEPVDELIEDAKTGITMDLENIRNFDAEDDFNKMDVETFEVPESELNLDDLFDKASKNAKEASNIFNQNLELRRQIDEKYNELLKLTEEQEKAKNSALEEIENYKNEVYNKLKEQKTEVEEKIEELKKIQQSIEEEKANFEQYRKEEIEKITNMQKEQMAAIEKEKADIASIEEKLVLRKNRLDQERDQIKAEREIFDKERENLKTNLMKFNELVGGFTTGIDQFSNTNTTNNLEEE